ncbi:MAG: thioredoxin [Gemmataceae bacterium]|jgi:putative thioredoxin|nr:thioredoxin [Gemmataceae bacterium]
MNSPHIVDIQNERDFQKKILEGSQQVPVVVDFWAEWCQPCRQLAPILEKLAVEFAGAFILAKVDIDRNQRIAQYFQIESIPAVIAFQNGQPVNGFTGLLPEADIREFIESITGGPKLSVLDQAAAMEETNPEDALAIYQEVLQQDPKNEKAQQGQARIYLATNRLNEAKQIIAGLGGDNESERLRKLLEMREGASQAGDIQTLQQQIKANPNDAQLKYQLGNALASQGKYAEALEVLIAAAELDRDLAKNQVRELMVKIFEIIGVRSEMSDAYRDRLRAILY